MQIFHSFFFVIIKKFLNNPYSERKELISIQRLTHIPYLMLSSFILFGDVCIRTSTAYYRHYFALFYVNCLPYIRKLFPFPLHLSGCCCCCCVERKKFLHNKHKITCSHAYVRLKKGLWWYFQKILIFNFPCIYFCFGIFCRNYFAWILWIFFPRFFVSVFFYFSYSHRF